MNNNLKKQLLRQILNIKDKLHLMILKKLWDSKINDIYIYILSYMINKYVFLIYKIYTD